MAIDPKRVKLELKGIRPRPRDKMTLEQQLEEASVKIRLIPQIIAMISNSSLKSKMECELEEAKVEHQRLSALIESRNHEKT
ncbi:MAG: hypothetical protein ACOVQN_00480 [Exiguobacterium sp.]